MKISDDYPTYGPDAQRIADAAMVERLRAEVRARLDALPPTPETIRLLGALVRLLDVPADAPAPLGRRVSGRIVEIVRAAAEMLHGAAPVTPDPRDSRDAEMVARLAREMGQAAAAIDELVARAETLAAMCAVLAHADGHDGPWAALRNPQVLCLVGCAIVARAATRPGRPKKSAKRRVSWRGYIEAALGAAGLPADARTRRR